MTSSTAFTNTLRGKNVVIMGATKGIGEAISRRFYEIGANIFLVARSKVPLEKLQKELIAQGQENSVQIQALDITHLDAVQDLFQKVEDDWQTLDILINNAAYNSRGPVATKSFEDLGKIVAVNLSAHILNCRAAIPYLKKSKGQIINIASQAGRAPVPGNATYSATKFGLRAFSMALREELASDGVAVSIVSPGPVITPFIMDDLDNVPDVVFSQKLSVPEDIACLVEAVALDRKREKISSLFSALSTHMGYLFPSLRSLVEKRLERKGAKVKQRLKQESAKHKRT